MTQVVKHLLIITIFVLVATFLIWLPHLLAVKNLWGLNFSSGFNTIYRNFDGLEYIVIAKTFYEPGLIAGIPQPMKVGYYASHFPGYSIAIATFAILVGHLKSMLFVSILFTILSTWIFYLLVRDFKLSENSLVLSLIFLILPARWLVVHSVGSSEPMFIFLVITSIYFFMKFEESLKYPHLLYSALFGLLAQITRPPGILLFIALSLFVAWKITTQRVEKFSSIIRLIGIYSPLLLMPVGLLLIFFWYSITYHDFFAYFHSGDNIHLTFPPFQVFNKNQFWVGDIWLEDIIYIFLLGFSGTVLLFKQKLYPLAFFVLIYLIASISIAHRDVSRYLLPIAPFVIIAFEKMLVSKEFRIVLVVLALAIYLYSQNYIIHNIAPVADLTPYN